MSLLEALGFIPAWDKPGMVAHAHNPSTGEGRAGKWGAQGHLWLYIEFEDSLGYVRFCLKRKERWEGKGRKEKGGSEEGKKEEKNLNLG